MVNACLDRIRRRQAHPTVPLPDGNRRRTTGTGGLEPAAPAPDHDTALVVREALAALPAEQRAALVLVDVQGYPVAEVARILGVAEGTVKSRCARGRARLAVLLGHLRPAGVGTPSADRTPPARSGRARRHAGEPRPGRGRRIGVGPIPAGRRPGGHVTTEGFREVDNDLLADYLGGALDGTPQQDEVARLVADGPGLGRGVRAAGPRVAEVSTDLTRWAEPSPEMPPAIIDRLVAALADRGADDRTTARPSGRAAERRSGRRRRAPLVVPVQGGSGRRAAVRTPGAVAVRRASHRPGPPPARLAPAGGAPVAAAAVAVVAVALGLNQLSTGAGDRRRHQRQTGRPARPRTPRRPGAAPPAPALRSGTDYTPQTLGNAHGRPPSAPTPAESTGDAPGAQPEVDAEDGRRRRPTGRTSWPG